MAQADGVVANGTGAAVRSDLNNQLAAVFTNHSGSSEPSTKYAYQWWADTTTGQLKLRNSANNAWITIFELDGTMLMEDGTVSAPGLAFASDLNTGFFRDAADKINFATGGVERLEIGSSEVVFNDGSNDVDFRVESNGQTHMLFVDGGNDRVGIGESSPDQTFHVKTTSDDVAKLESTSNGNGPNLTFAHTGSSPADDDIIGKLTFTATNDASQQTTFGDIRAVSSDVTDGSEDGAFTFNTRADGSFAERLRITSDGNLGVGTAAPAAKLHVENTSGVGGLLIEGSNLAQIILSDNNGGTNDKNVVLRNSQQNLLFGTQDDGFSSFSESLRIRSGGGLTFNGDTAAANALNDYEEGTWTPVPSDGSNTSTISAIQCRYTKIGRLVYIRGSLLNINTTGMTSGNTFRITGLPFPLSPNVTNARCAFPVATDAITTTKGVVASISENSTSFQLHEVDDAVYGTTIKVSALVHGDADIWVNFSYETD